MSQNNRLSPLDLLNQSNQEFMAALENGNAAKIAQLYTEQGQLFPANAETIRGREAIRAFWQRAMDQGVKSAKLKTVEIECLEDTLIEVGRYILCGSNDQILDMGKYLVVWKLIATQYFLYKNIWTTSMPAHRPVLPLQGSEDRTKLLIFGPVSELG